MKIAFLFPGQGSQHIGMGLDFYENDDMSKQTIKMADEHLGFPVSQVMFNGPEEELKKTSITQPAIYLFSVLVTDRLFDMGITPDGVCGHSVGEYAAHYAAGSIDFIDGLKLVKVRSMAMESAAIENPGGMLAILGLPDETVYKICRLINRTYPLNVANLNCPHQVVVSGTEEALKKAEIEFKEAGAKKIVRLNVSGAWHSNLMKPAERVMASKLKEIHFSPMKYPLYANVSAEVLPQDDIVKSLTKQICSPVKFKESIEKMIEDGFDVFIEAGGKVLSGLVKRIKRDLRIYPIMKYDDLTKLKESL